MFLFVQGIKNIMIVKTIVKFQSSTLFSPRCLALAIIFNKIELNSRFERVPTCVAAGDENSLSVNFDPTNWFGFSVEKEQTGYQSNYTGKDEHSEIQWKLEKGWIAFVRVTFYFWQKPCLISTAI